MSNSPQKNSTRLTVVAGLFVIGASIVGALITWHPWTATSQSNMVKTPKVIAGAVIEEFSNSGVSHAEIILVGRNEHYYTEGNGNFRIQLLGDSVDHIRILVSKANYDVYDRSYEVPSENIIIVLQKKK